MGRHHHRKFTLWVLMMFVPSVSLLANVLMTGSNNYQPLFLWNDLEEFRISKPLIYYGRGIFVAILFCVLFVGNRDVR